MPKKNKVRLPIQRVIPRSQINFASYNPRKISPEARKKLKANLKERGLMGGIVWNATTGNLVSGHQRVSIMDEINKYDPLTQKNDYEINVDVVELDEKSEKEQNLFMNNRSVQGEFDDEMLRSILQGIDYTAAGFDDFDISMLGISDESAISQTEVNDITAKKDWNINSVKNTADDDTRRMIEETSVTGEQRRIDRATDFYEDSKENQIARHNEIKKIKDRILELNSSDRDAGALSYIIVSFNNPTEKERFLEDFGFNPGWVNIDGTELIERIEFGLPDDSENNN